jgi:hypothetical protein
MKANRHTDKALNVLRSAKIETNARCSFWQQRERIVRERLSVVTDEGHDPRVACMLGKPMVSAMPKVAQVGAVNVSKRCLDKPGLNINRSRLQ